ncbi:diaminopimelate epimerase [candidate division LCP-89 bacterium B3_LCP]|uniref:Diaminopimelate epimerase n=1 Tax=candidate division LCP-89 bacterium B3_LCP TaxID=2012998 RepID=A0A532V0S1_UNCL8|nr:MAG: diaminopimelate epimerase [candidate division LCP-89 bacterium B3_LCP]
MEITPRQPSKNVMYFSKYHATGNDFILVDGIKYPETPSWWHTETIFKLCTRHFGIGSDGLIVLLESEESDCRMKYFNADGQEAQICGNGLRCLALFVRDQGYPVNSPMTIQTLGGDIVVDFLTGDRVRVAMPPVSFNRLDLPMRGQGDCIDEELKLDKDTKLKITALSVGNPHVVIFGEYSDDQFNQLGPVLEKHSLFPEHVNVSFVEVKGPDTIWQRVWERGSGPTLSCGSGAVAAVAAGIAKGVLPFAANIKVEQPGGELVVAIADQYAEATLEGEAVYVFHGVLEF